MRTEAARVQWINRVPPNPVADIGPAPLFAADAVSILPWGPTPTNVLPPLLSRGIADGAIDLSRNLRMGDSPNYETEESPPKSVRNMSIFPFFWMLPANF